MILLSYLMLSDTCYHYSDKILKFENRATSTIGLSLNGSDNQRYIRVDTLLE